jgi:hexosaminidase
LIDTSRTFVPIAYLRRYVDLLALYKMNVLQLHLTDDQGWRVEVKKHPRLTSVGSKFDERYNEFGGYYMQKDIKDLVAYASARNVTILPEIEMPGHCAAALAAYPDLGCRNQPQVIFPFMEALVPGLQPCVFCAGNDRTFEVLEDVLSEVIELFPSRYIHIGGDEAVKDWWKTCPKCQARIKAEGLKDESELQSYFVKRIERFLDSKHRKLIGWDEILEGGLAPRAAVMSWRGTVGGVEAIGQGHDVVFSPTSHCYFDYPNAEFSTVNVYSYEPVPEGITEEQSRHVLGAQGNMWTHIARSEDAIDRQVFPRLIALSEVTWSPRESRNLDDFLARLARHFPRLDALGVKYSPPIGKH